MIPEWQYALRLIVSARADRLTRVTIWVKCQ